MWRMILLAGVIAVSAYQFNINDESEYVDNPEDGIFINDSAPVTAVVKEDVIEEEIEKLLGQPIIHEEPATLASPDSEPTTAAAVSSSSTVGSSSTKPTQPREVTAIPNWIEEAQEREIDGHGASRRKNTRAQQRTSEVIYSVRVAGGYDFYPQQGQKFRPGVIESLVGAHDIVRFETRGYPIRPSYTTWSSYEPTRTSYDPWTLEISRTTYKPTWTREASRTAHENPRMKEDATTAYIEDKKRTAKNTTWKAYNEGGFRSASVDGGFATVDGRRQNLLTLPAYLVTTTTRRPRPTPVYYMPTTKYKFTRRTRRNPNCTDSYYDCLNLCFDRRGYKVSCVWWTKPTRPEPARMNMTGLFWAIQQEYRITEYDVTNIFRSWKDQLIERGYRSCRTFTPRITTPKKIYPVYYDDTMSKLTGRIMAKCWVCGLRDTGIPRNTNCFDNFADAASSSALAEKHTYRKYCRYMDEVPLWFNRSDPFSVWGQWTGGCSYRFLDVSGLYAQRACRSTILPAQGDHFLSRRMARLELALRDEKEGCVVSPMATLVPLSRAVSLFARFTVCVCRGSWCNPASRREPSLALMFILFVLIRAFAS